MKESKMLNKKEILFLWDGQNWNPNGDFLRDNMPRNDERTEVAEVTDVRIKRTIRDEILKSDEASIFVKEYKDGDSVMDAKKAIRTRINVDQSEEAIKRDVLNAFIDVRAFGAVIPINGSDDKKEEQDQSGLGLLDEEEEPTKGKKKKGKKDETKKGVSSVKFTGPVQFRMSKSLHKVDIEEIQGSAAFASDDKKENKSLRTEYILKYAMLATYGIIDNYNAIKTNFTEEDANKILKSLWNGTKNLISRSKMGQMPRFMLIVTYKDDTFAGDLNNSLKIVCDKDDREIRNLDEFKIDFSQLKAKLSRYADKIEKIEYVSDFDFDAVNKTNYDPSWIKKEF